MAKTPRGPDERENARIRTRRHALRRDLEEMRASARAEAGEPEAQADADETNFSPKEIERARRLVREGIAWVRENPSAWEYALRLADADVSAGRRVSAAGIIHRVRQKDFTTRSGTGTSISNSLEPVLSRLILLSVPGASKFVERRRTPVDAVMTDEVVGYDTY